jgi:branched-chain amino acid transport system substrate-binding protein
VEAAGEAAACHSYKDCAEAIRAGRRPDYDGESGRINFDANGDITAAGYVVYSYGADNLATMSGSETAGSNGG